MAKLKTVSEPMMVEIPEIQLGNVRFNIVGSLLIQNRMSEKARQYLLLPPPQKNKAELEATLKHDPMFEFRSSMYRTLRDPKPAARLHVPLGSFARAIEDVAIDIPGVAKAQMERLTSVADTHIALYGIPELFMTTVRQSGMNRTPDIRTRAILPEFACTVNIRYVRNLVREKNIINLMMAAGVIIGLGDNRPQKGGSNGQFHIVSDDDKDFKRIVAEQGRVAQDAAIDKPNFFDAESEELYSWFVEEVARREKEDHIAQETMVTKPVRRVARKPKGGHLADASLAEHTNVKEKVKGDNLKGGNSRKHA